MGTLGLTPNSRSVVIQMNSYVYTHALLQVLSLLWEHAAPNPAVLGAHRV